MTFIDPRPRALRAAATALVGLALLAPQGAERADAAATVSTVAAPQQARARTRARTRARPTSRRPARTRARVARVVLPPPPSWTSPASASALANDLSSMLDGRVRSGKWGVMVVSLTRGDTLFARNAGDMMQPASTLKLYAAAVALDRFGPEHTFSTDVLRDGAVGGDGTLAGNIYLRGDADPSMSSRFWRDANLPMNTLARSVAAAGVRRVRGDLVYDATAFDDQRIPEGWKTTYLGAAYAAPFSALSLNENVVWVVVRPEGRTARVTLEPASTTMPVVSQVRVVGGGGGRITARRTADGNLLVTGVVGASGGEKRYSLVINDPALFAGGALRAALEANGVTVEGAVRPGKTPPGAQKVASFTSPPLSWIVSEMNRESINVVAELLYRAAARPAGGQATAPVALAHLRDFMARKVGADPAAIDVKDGSGLSTLDFLTPRTMIQLLSYAHRGPWSSAFHGSLPVAGESELLRRRMRTTPAQGNLHAKTGTTNTVVGLGGYVTAKDGEIIAFSFLYNGNDRGNARQAMDAMGATLANFVRN